MTCFQRERFRLRKKVSVKWLEQPAKKFSSSSMVLGDIIQGIDGFASIRNGHPNAEISLLTTAPFAKLAEMMPFFDQVLIDPRAKFWNVPALIKIRNIMGKGWTRIYDFQSSKRTRQYF